MNHGADPCSTRTEDILAGINSPPPIQSGSCRWEITKKHNKTQEKTRKACRYAGFIIVFGGSGEIRTHGGFPHAGFQDRCIQPLCHPSERGKYY